MHALNPKRYQMIPIVLGAYREDYISTRPPHSYINVDGFRSIRELAAYIKYHDQNDAAYVAYFAWRQYGELSVSLKTYFSLMKRIPTKKVKCFPSLKETSSAWLSVMWPDSPNARGSNATGEETTRVLRRPHSPLFQPPSFSFKLMKKDFSVLKSIHFFLDIKTELRKKCKILK